MTVDSTIEQRIEAKGFELPAAPPPVGSYVPAVHAGQLVYTSGQLPLRNGRLINEGKVGGGVTPDEAVHCARQCAVNALAAIRAEVGSLEAITRVVKVVVFVSSGPHFTNQPEIANGASDFLTEVFGDAGRHARSAVSVVSLPLNAPVELEMIVEVNSAPSERGR